MTGTFEKPITIRQAIRNIDDRTFLLPAIQRKFVWSPQQICVLFDSLMRGYPINTFMVWDVTTAKVKDEYKFYGFLNDYCERFRESNEHVPTKGDFKDFKAVIDGQQRLTSIYIGLKGTYAYKKPRSWWPPARNDATFPPRKLYLNILAPVDDSAGGEAMTRFDFRFLTEAQIRAAQKDDQMHWFEVGQILGFPEVSSLDQITFDAVMPYLEPLGLASNVFARKTLTRLYFLVRSEEVIHYYCEQSQEIDRVLDVFIRTNSGGTPLAFSDLLMSIAVANWEGDARKEIDDLVTESRQTLQLSVSRDWVLKSCLVLTEADVRFRVANFDTAQVSQIQARWPGIRECLTETLKLAKGYGLNDSSLRAKNALIPIAYYLYKQTWREQPLYKSINNLAYLREERQLISRWLNIVLLRGTFGGQADSVLRKTRRVLRANLDKARFPLDEIVAAFAGGNKDLRFDEIYLEGLLDIQYGDPRCRSVLSLLFPETNENQSLDIDHLHPGGAFAPSLLKKEAFLLENAELMEFYRDPRNWNSIQNLHLLNASQNRSKKDLTLAQWMAGGQSGFRMPDLLLDEDDSPSFKDFQAFCKKRRAGLLSRLRARVMMSEALMEVDALSDDDEEDEESLVEA